MKTHFCLHVRRAGQARASEVAHRSTYKLCIPVND